MKQATLFLGAALLLMSGCASTPELTPEQERALLLAQRPAIDSVPSSGLGPQDLPAGECGLFLWSKTDLSKLIFFSKALSGQAVFAQGEDPITLTQTGAGGDIFGQFNTRMSYLSGDGREIRLDLVPGDMMNGGQRLQSSLVNLVDAEGWQTVLPVLGVRACQPE
ncbi:MAG: hypothetical protein ACX94B_12210 [Henriciella sp.]|nr:hypothetical protein [Hyphomonadaceae bacterium]